MPQDRVHLDFETFATVALPNVGASRYSRHPETEVLMAAWSVNDVKQKQWIPAEGEAMPPEFRDAMEDPHVIKWAWNAPFERSILANVLGIDTPIESWRDTMVLALTCSLPGKLEKAGPVVDLDEDKQKASKGRRLMKKFSEPRKPTKTDPKTRVHWYHAYSDWVEYLDYNERDEAAERAIYHRLKQYAPPDHEWDLWHLDQRINEAGIPINMRMVRNAISIYESTLADKLEEMRDLTGVANANSRDQILPWLEDHGFPFADMKKGHIARAIERRKDELADVSPTNDDIYLRVLELRAETSRTSPKKFHALERAVDPKDEVLRYAFQFAGAARTWRWGGRLFQPQNLPRPIKKLEKQLPLHAKNVEILTPKAFHLIYDNPMDVLASVIRPAAQAPEGYVFIDADLNAIENRVLGWLARCEKILRVFRLGRDPYIDFATYLFGRPYGKLLAEYKAGDSTKRTISKPGVLGCLTAETPVLTNRGWKCLIDVSADDLVHDGTGWVKHDGVVYRGRKAVLCRSGIHATPDHQFLQGSRWVEHCRLVENPRNWELANATANGLLSGALDRRVRPEHGIGVSAVVDWSEKFRGSTFFSEKQLDAIPALKKIAEGTLVNESGQTCTTYLQIVSTLRGHAAKTRRIRLMNTTEGEAFVCSSVRPTNGLITLSHSGQTVRLNVTGETTMTTIDPETCVSRHDPNRMQISETWDILNSGANSRFVVLTEDGPLVAHNCGYMLGPGEERTNRKTGEKEATGLLGYAWAMQIYEFTQAQSELSVKTFRREFEEVKDYWYDIERAAKRCINTGKRVYFDRIYFDRKGPFMRMGLPSGRHLHYCRPRIENVRTPWGEMKPTITYESQNDRKQWERVSTHPGKLTENADQAISRDLLAHGMSLADKRGLDIRLHVHDQIVGLVREDEAEEKLKVLIECMEDQPEWAKDLPLGSNGFISKVFMKD